MFSKIKKLFFGSSNGKNVVQQTSHSINEIERVDGVTYLDHDLNKSVKVSLAKSNDSFKKVISLAKKEDKVARVGVLMDGSGSMRSAYESGLVNDIFTRLLPIALKFDDNGELESWIFNTHLRSLEPVTKDNYKKYTDDVKKHVGGGTNFAPALRDVYNKYYVNGESDMDNYIIFITDGANMDVDNTKWILDKFDSKTFIQFICIDYIYGDIDYLYSQMRKYDNVNIIAIEDISRISDDTLYNALMKNYK